MRIQQGLKIKLFQSVSWIANNDSSPRKPILAKDESYGSGLNINRYVSMAESEFEQKNNRAIRHKSIFENKKSVGYDDLDYQIVRDIKNANNQSFHIVKEFNDFK